jgi:hypothetical protein
MLYLDIYPCFLWSARLVKLPSIPAREKGRTKAFGVPRAAAVMRRPSSKADNHKNIIATTAVDPSRSTTPPLTSIGSDALQAIYLQFVSTLQTHRHLASLSRSRVFRAWTRTRSWRDRDVQQPKSFVWSPTRPTNRLCLRSRSPIRALSIWSGCWHDRPHVTSFKRNQPTGRETASRSKEVAS